MKSVAHRDGLWHKSIHCWIVRSENEGSVLFQRRGADKFIYPGALDISAAGHYRSGELLENGVREIAEELGISVPFANLVYLGVEIDLGLAPPLLNHEFCETFLLREDRRTSQYLPDPEEVAGLVEISIPDGIALFSSQFPTNSVRASGIEYDAQASQWRDIDIRVSKEDFIARVDNYYYKVFMLDDLMLKGYAHLTI